MKQIKSKAGIGWVREANHAKTVAIERLSNVPNDTVDNSIERLRLFALEIAQAIEEIERDREIINAHRNQQ